MLSLYKLEHFHGTEMRPVLEKCVWDADACVCMFQLYCCSYRKINFVRKKSYRKLLHRSRYSNRAVNFANHENILT